MAPNQHPTRFMAPIVTDTDVADAAFSGNRSRVSLHTATTELSTDSGICGTAPLRNPCFHASRGMRTTRIRDGPARSSRTATGWRATANATPTTNTITADGIAGAARLIIERQRPSVSSWRSSSSWVSPSPPWPSP